LKNQLHQLHQLPLQLPLHQLPQKNQLHQKNPNVLDVNQRHKLTKLRLKLNHQISELKEFSTLMMIHTL
jgi:hypothetical protein